MDLNKETIERLKKGDKGALEELFNRYFIPLCTYAADIIGDPTSAEDIVSDFFCFIWEKRRFIRIKSVPSYLFTSIKNRCYNYLKHQKTIQKYQKESEYFESDITEINIEFLNNDTTHSEITDLAGQIQLAIEELPPQAKQIFIKPNDEIIFARPFHQDHRGRGHNLETTSSSPGFGGWGMNCPIHNFVQDFQMANGKMIYEEGSGYNPSTDSIYLNRELRFYSSVLFQGAIYKGREMEYHLPGGKDSKDGPQPNNASKTGYNIRKLLDEDEDFSKTLGDQPWIYLRLAEIYLNYAEAQYHLGNEDKAREYVNIIRNRVHLPDINSSGEELYKDIQHERRIELRFEHHRYFDVRRWMIADSVESIDFLGTQWKKLNKNGELDPDGELTFEVYTVLERNFFDKMYYLPIPQSEIEKSGIMQNPGY